MKQILIAHQKGGVGKSTIAVNLSYAFKKAGYKVGLYDTDKQGTSYQCAQNVDVYTQENEIPTGLDYLIIDTPPYNSTIIVDFLSRGVDFVIIPTRAGIPDILAIRDTLDLVESGIYKNNSIQAGILFNAVDDRTKMVDSVKDQVKRELIPIMATEIKSRVALNRSLLSDEGVFSSQDKEAQREIESLKNEIISVLNDSKS